MKKTNYLWSIMTIMFVAILSFGLTACGDDEKDDMLVGENDIVGPSEYPPQTLFEEPFISWGTYRSSVKSTMSSRGYELMTDKKDSNGEYYLQYKPKYKEYFSEYDFKSLKLNEVYIVIKRSVVQLDAVRNYLQNSMGYDYLTETTDNGYTYYYYQKPNTKTVAAAYNTTFSNEDMVFVEYFEYNPSARESDIDEEPTRDVIFEGSLSKPERNLAQRAFFKR